MKILIDADACPVKEIVIELAKANHLNVIMISNINHELHDDYSEIIRVDAGRDVADHMIISKMDSYDLVITQDYGLAALVLGKKGYAMHHDGWFFSSKNIDMLLMKRYLHQKMRRMNKRFSGPLKRDAKNNETFRNNLSKFLKDTLIRENME